MKKAVVFLFGAFLISCGGGSSVSDGSSSNGGTSPPSSQPSGLQITYFNVNPGDTNYHPGQTFTVSAAWSSDRQLTQTGVKVCFTREPYYVCDVNAPRFLFSCDGQGDACQGSFSVDCTYTVADGRVLIECTLPDGTVSQSYGVNRSYLPKRYCTELYLRAADVSGNVLYDSITVLNRANSPRCFTLQP